jgi:signal transduction histidine kinase
MVVGFGRDLTVQFAGGAVDRLQQVPGTPVEGKTLEQADIMEPLRSCVHEAVGRVLETGKEEWFAVAKPGPQGILHCEVVIVPVCENGQIHTAIATIHDITVRAQTRAQLGHANATLERFAYAASHDLREPLRMVSIYSELLGKSAEGKLDPQARTFLGYIQDGARRLNALVSDLLAFSRVNRVNEREAPAYPLEEGLRKALDKLQPEMDAVGAEVVYDKLPVVRAHPEHMVQLLENLVGNAIKFRSQEAPRVEIRARQEEGGAFWRVAVRDNGIGIAPQFHEKAFELFSKLHSSTKYKGTGLGLAICRQIVEHYGGRIAIDSKAGGGAEFSFTLPAGAGAGAAAGEGGGRSG